jgi:hypothetical protein
MLSDLTSEPQENQTDDAKKEGKGGAFLQSIGSKITGAIGKLRS